jgi:hypothetical protein
MRLRSSYRCDLSCSQLSTFADFCSKFQVTVSITTVMLTFVSAVAGSEEQSVLTAVQLMWVNLIQNTMAALALATDPPAPSILNRKPDPKSAPLISATMLKMIVGQSIYQLAVTLILYFGGAKILSYQSAHEKAQLQTVVFNTFVWMQIFNQYKYVRLPLVINNTLLTSDSNRRLDNKFNIFEGISRNRLFIAISLVMIGCQVMIILVGGKAFSITRLDGAQWGYSVILGALSIPIGAVIRLIPDKLFEEMCQGFLRRQTFAATDEQQEFQFPQVRDLTFLKRVRGRRRPNNLKFAIQNSNENLLPWLGNGSRSRGSSILQNPTGDQPGGSGFGSQGPPTPESYIRHYSRSRSHSAFGPVATPGMMANDPSHNTFTYRPLASGHIRLLSMSENEGELIHELSHVDLASSPKYLTLSYTWADQARDQDLLINGAVLKVINNITIALPYLFEQYQSHPFWIDGICINQDDDREKEVQVPLMHKIYTQAATGIIWLGESNSLIDLAIPMIPTLVEKFRGYDYRLGFHQHSFAAQGLPNPSSAVWAGLDDLFCRDWFTRVWTFQEAILPRFVDILCSRHFISLYELARLATIMLNASLSGTMDSISDATDDNKWRAQCGMERTITVQDVRIQRISQPTKTYPFLDLLSKSWHWSCSNPLDKIYGLLGLADRSLQEQLVVDYKKTPAEVYLAFTKCWIPRDLHLEIFHMTPSSDHLLELPSWCPNFNDQPVATLFGPQASTAQYRAGVKVEKICHVAISPDSTAVRVEGFRVDEIAEVLPCPWERQRHVTAESKNAGIAQILMWERKCLELSKLVYSTRDEVPPAHWRTLIANKHANGQYFTGCGRETYHLTRVMMSRLTTTEIPLSPTEQLLAMNPLTNAQLLEAQDMGEAFGYASNGRSFFSTHGGRVGLGLLHIKPGDVICIFYNGYTPYIIRPREEYHTRKSNKFLGESYVDGLMYGEALEKEDKNPDEFFTLE